MIFTSFLQYEKVHMSLNDHLVAMSETQSWTSFALLELNFQFLELNFQFLEDNFKMSEPCVCTANGRKREARSAGSMFGIQKVRRAVGSGWHLVEWPGKTGALW